MTSNGKSTKKPSIRASLRETTQSLHEDVEAFWMSNKCFDSEDTYRRFLTTVLAAHQSVGLRAAKVRGDLDDVKEEENRIAALCADLSLSVPHQSDGPDGEDSRMSASYAWGVGYVLNGSALGAAVMLDRGYLKDGWPDQYFLLGRALVRTGGLKRFFDRLNNVPLDEADVANGAKDTFSIFRDDHDTDRSDSAPK